MLFVMSLAGDLGFQDEKSALLEHRRTTAAAPWDYFLCVCVLSDPVSVFSPLWVLGQLPLERGVCVHFTAKGERSRKSRSEYRPMSEVTWQCCGSSSYFKYYPAETPVWHTGVTLALPPTKSR